MIRKGKSEEKSKKSKKGEEVRRYSNTISQGGGWRNERKKRK